jgi:hypothetical protein
MDTSPGNREAGLPGGLSVLFEFLPDELYRRLGRKASRAADGLTKWREEADI